MIVIIEKIFSIFLILAIGYFCSRINILPTSGLPVLSNLLMKCTLPCLLISSIANQQLESNSVHNAVILVCLSVPLFFIAPAFCSLVCKKIISVENKDDIGVYAYCFGSTNTGFMGFPIALALFGEKILYMMVIENLALQFYMYGIGMLFLGNNRQDGKIQIKEIFKSLKNVCLISSLIGLALLFAQIHLPQMLNETITTVGNATIPLSMLFVGVQLNDRNFSAMIKDKKLVLVSLLRMVVWPILLFLMVNWMPIGPEIKLSLIFAFSFPLAFVVSATVAQQGKNGTKAAEMIGITTLISFVTLPVIAAVLTFLYC